MKITKIRFKVGHQNPLSEPTVTNDKYDLQLFGEWFRISAKHPNKKPMNSFRVHLSCIDFITIDEEAEGLEEVLANDSFSLGRICNTLPEEPEEFVPCHVVGCIKANNHRGRHVVKIVSSSNNNDAI